MQNIPTYALDALQQLHTAGYEAYLVGGCVRDSLLGMEPHDIDITTSALPEEIIRCFNGHPVVTAGMRHGTVTVLWDSIPLEITTFRTEGIYSDHRHPDAVFYAKTLQEDLCRRDFTVNAMAWSTETGLIDFYNGRDDLENHIIRCVGDPKIRFQEDALRILRAARFASTLNWEIDSATLEAMLIAKEDLKNVSVERILSEFVKLLCGEGAEQVLQFCREIIAVFIPEIRPCFGFEQHTKYHCYDVYTHITKVVSGTPKENKVLRLAAFFHDIEKPSTFQFYDGSGHFKGHPEASAITAENVMNRLHADKKTTQLVVELIRWHDVDMICDRKHMVKLLQAFPGEQALLLVELMKADCLAKSDIGKMDYPYLLIFGEAVITALAEGICVNVNDLKISGDDLIALGVEKGPAIGKMQKTLLDLVISQKIENQHDELIKITRELLTDK